MLALRSGLVMVVVALAATGCGEGEGEGLIERPDLRDCLTENGARVQGASSATSPSLGSVTVDLHAQLEGVAVDLVLERNERRARRAAADVRASLATFGVAAPDRRLLRRRNLLAVFQADPNAAARELVESCLE